MMMKFKSTFLKWAVSFLLTVGLCASTIAASENSFLKPEQLSSAQTAVIVLGCLPLDEQNPGLDMISRVQRGVQVFKAEPQAYLVFTGGKEGFQISEARLMASLAQSYGVLPENILIEEESRSTLENAALSRKLIGEAMPAKTILVSRADHLKRALQTFTDQGFSDVVARSADCPLPRIRRELEAYLRTHPQANKKLHEKLNTLQQIEMTSVF